MNKQKISSFKMTMAKKPYYNAYGGGYGPHGDTKYNRRKIKDSTRKEIKNYM